MAAPRVLILGGTGMLGGALWRGLSGVPGWRVRRSQRRDRSAPGWFDALAQDAEARLDALLREDGGADFALNAIGLTKPEIKDGDPESEAAARAVNTEVPRALARAASRAGARVIHISTDGVFSGKAGPYDESAVPDPVDVYGLSKLAGEVAAPHVLTLRCSIVGPDPEKRRGLYEWFKGLERGAAAKGYTDQLWNGVTTVQFAALCRAVIETGAFDRLAASAPVRHFCPNEPVSKHALLGLFNEALGAGVRVAPAVSGAAVNRILKSRWADLTDLVGGPTTMAVAVRAMVQGERHAQPQA